MAKEKQPRTNTSAKKPNRSQKTEASNLDSPVSSTPVAAVESAVAPAHDAVIEAKGRIDIDEVRRRAFQFFEERGRIHGYEAEDWFRAEQELRNGKKSA
jgi:hypothetical protein